MFQERFYVAWNKPLNPQPPFSLFSYFLEHFQNIFYGTVPVCFCQVHPGKNPVAKAEPKAAAAKVLNFRTEQKL